MNAAKVTALKPRAVDLDKLPIHVVIDRLDRAYATLDLLYELTLSSDADERIGSLGSAKLCTLVHGVLLQIDEAKEGHMRVVGAA
jgi:hypothetical protein